MLGRKQSIKNEEWLSAVSTIEETVSRKEIDELAAATVIEIQNHVKGYNAAYAWSGGKDSIVLGELCKLAGIHKGVIVVCDLEYPEFMRWVEMHKPFDVEILNVGYGLEWLAKHPEALFPPMTYHWSRFIQIAGENRYYREKGIELLILGRRKADGNYVGAGTNFYTDKAGRRKYNPLSDWSHEQVLAYIHYKKLSMPPIYQWENGYLNGTHPWFARPYIPNKHEGWRQIYQIDPSIVEEAAGYIQSAADYLREVNNYD